MYDLIIFDIDGVLTDGNLLFDGKGNYLKKISFKDLDSFNEIKKMNIKTMILSAEENDMTLYIKNKFEPHYFFAGIENKYSFLTDFISNNNMNLENVIYVGDGKKDFACMKVVGLSICPNDAIEDIKHVSNIILNSYGGNGVVSEIFYLLKNKLNSKSLTDENLYLNFDSIISEHKDLIEDMFNNKQFLSSIEKASKLISESLHNGHKVLSCGNGGSSCESQHLVSELIGRYNMERSPYPAIDLCAGEANITCISNDYSFDNLFERQVTALGKVGDVLIAFTTSGNSNNIINAIKCANNKNMVTILITSNKCYFNESSLVIKVPSRNTARIQEIHLMIIHYICQQIDNDLSVR